ncbi:hypothetical protein QE152_g13572 [Popillia japonica]|uniref:Uncharacterized protein n=1 Tax=Popillia japonica TaxID=7064 RepID=A0AAW1LC59_POPJA
MLLKTLAELHKRHDEPLSNEDLEELVEELDRQNSKEEEKESEEESLRVIRTADLKCILSNIETLTDELYDIDHDWDRRANVKKKCLMLF